MQYLGNNFDYFLFKENKLFLFYRNFLHKKNTIKTDFDFFKKKKKKKKMFFFFFFFLTCGFSCQSTTMVMSKRSFLLYV